MPKQTCEVAAPLHRFLYPHRMISIGSMANRHYHRTGFPAYIKAMGDITVLLGRARDGDRGAFDSLFDALYPDLRRIAHARLASHQRSTMLNTTVLVHECFLKFTAADRLTPTDRAHFLAYGAQVMRSIIVDLARARQSERRGGDAAHTTLGTDVRENLPAGEDEIMDVHEALEQLALLDARLAKVVEMRYFGGLREAEIAEALGVNERTIRRDWEKARLLLAAALREQ
jgi:RNA polymerase sigma factor (TIGR02999 family)